MVSKMFMKMYKVKMLKKQYNCLFNLIKDLLASWQFFCSTLVEQFTHNLKIDSSNPNTVTRGQCYKTFFLRNLRIFVISQSVCPQQAFLVQFIVCGQGQEPTLYCSTSKVIQQGRLMLYKQTLDQAGKACPGQTLQLITKVRKLRP